MKERITTLLMCCCLALVCGAKEIKTVIFTTNPTMVCQNCENKIKNNLRFEKGVKDIVTNLKEQTVTVKYDADKTNVQNLIAAFAKINYQATVVTSGQKQSCGSCGNSQQGSCCGTNAGASKAQQSKQDNCCRTQKK